MIDIYNEIGYVKDILQNGLDTNNWTRDVKLLVRYYKQEEGLKKKDIKPLVLEKCKELPFYNHLMYYKKLNKAIDMAYKKDEPLRDIDEIIIAKEVLDWFINLDKFEISKEKVKELKEKRPGVKITTHPMNLNRIKMLFTLYIWTKIQEKYLEKPNMHYLNNFIKKFKEESGVSSGFAVKKERDLLHDLGFIYVNFALGIDITFSRDFLVFNTIITKDNMVMLKGDDLYHPGYFLEKQKMGCFVCQNCGKEIAYKGKGKGEKSRKYCDNCSKELHTVAKTNGSSYTRICADCGNEFTVDNPKSKQRFCWSCKTKRNHANKKKYDEKRFSEKNV